MLPGQRKLDWAPNTFMISDEVLEQIEKEEPAIAAYEEIMEGLGIVLPSDSEYPNYPIEHGGAYYQDEKLHICLTENTAENQQKYLLLTSDESVVRFETVEYFYNDLYEITLQIADNCGAF